MTFDKAMKQFDHLSKDNFAKTLIELGLLTLADLERAPEMAKLKELLDQREVARQRIKDNERVVAELDALLATKCIHNFKTDHVSDNHDGFSRGEYTQYHHQSCTVCGHKIRTETLCTY